MTKPCYNTLRNLVLIVAVLFQVFGPLATGIAFAQQNPSTGYVPYTPGTIFDNPLSPNSPANNPPGRSSLDGVTGSDEELSAIADTLGFTETEDGSYVRESGPASSPGDNRGNGDVVSTWSYYSSKNEEGFYGIMISAGGFLAGLGGVIFDYTFDLTVSKFGCLLTKQDVCKDGWNGEVGGVVNDLWEVIRDLFNIVFIFSLVYIGLRLILKSDDSATQKSIGMLIAAALLVNFSLYIAKLIIDIANYTAVQIHSAMVSGINGQYVITTFFSLEKHSIAGAFMEVLRIASWFGGDAKLSDGANAIVLGIFSFIFLAYLGFIFLYGAIMLITRLIALIILLIFSPMMFLGWVLPQFKQYSSQWMAMFIGYSFYIPAFVFLLYMSLFTMIQLAKPLAKNAGYGDAVIGSQGGGVTTGAFEIYFMFFMGVGLLYASTKVAGIISKAGAGAAMNFASTAAKTVSTGFAGRYVVGGAGGGTLSGLGNQIEKRFGSGITSRALISGGEKLEKNKYGGSWSLKDSRDAATKGSSRASRAQAVKKIQNALNSRNPDAIKAALKDATGSQIEQIAQSRSGQKLLSDNVQYLKKDHIKAIKDSKSESITDDFKQKIDNSHTEASTETLLGNLGAAVTTPGAEITQLHQASKDQLDAIGAKTLQEPQNAVRLNKKQMGLLEELKNDGKISSSDFIDIKNTRESGLNSIAGGSNVRGSTLTKDDLYRSAEAVPDLPETALVAISRELPRNALREVAKKSPKGVQQKVRTQLETTPGYRAPTPPAGTVIKDMDPGTMSPEERLYVFLNFDDIGKDLGR